MALAHAAQDAHHHLPHVGEGRAASAGAAAGRQHHFQPTYPLVGRRGLRQQWCAAARGMVALHITFGYDHDCNCMAMLAMRYLILDYFMAG